MSCSESNTRVYLDVGSYGAMSLVHKYVLDDTPKEEFPRISNIYTQTLETSFF